MSDTRVKTLSFATHELPPRRRSQIQPLLIPRFKDNPNFESGFTSRPLPLITNRLVILSAMFPPSPFFFSFAPEPFPHHISRFAVGVGLPPLTGAAAAVAQVGSAPGIPNHPTALYFFLWTSLSVPILCKVYFSGQESRPRL